MAIKILNVILRVVNNTAIHFFWYRTQGSHSIYSLINTGISIQYEFSFINFTEMMLKLFAKAWHFFNAICNHITTNNKHPPRENSTFIFIITKQHEVLLKFL